MDRYTMIGHLTNRPAWKLIGESVRERIEAYDGTLYFSDVWFKDRGVRAVVEEVEEAVRFGYPAVKLKLGRGFKWMPKEEGRARDIAVVNAVREAVGPGIRIMADPNNGYTNDYDGAWNLLSKTRAANLYWIEEIFPETIQDYTRLKADFDRAGMETLIADGENLGSPAPFIPYLKPKRLIDVVQMDVRRGGFLSSVELARMAGEADGVSIPHNWASQLGVIMGMHLSKAVKSIPAVEDDRSTCDVLVAEGYRFAKGSYTVPDSPGLGVRIDEKVYNAKYKAAEISIS